MVLKDKYIFILGFARFDGPFESTSFTMAKELAKNNQVFYIDHPFTWKDIFKLKTTTGYKNRKPYFSFLSDGLIDTGIPRLKVLIIPPVFSINFIPEGKFFRRVLKLNEWLISSRIKKVIRRYSIKEFIYVNSFNFHYPDIPEMIKPDLTVYQCVDPLIIPYDVRHGMVSETLLVKTSKLVICTSKQLYKEKKLLNANTFFVPNAADIAHSSRALNEELPVDRSLENIKKPVIGYLGTIERRIDYDLLKEVVSRNRDKSFVFSGPVSSEYLPGWFYNTPNVYLTGPVPYQQVPNLYKGFDVAIIPFKKDPVSRTIFPLKIFEYLGAGKPVVSTDFNPDLQEAVGGVVAFCSDALSFSEAISQALDEDSSSKIEERLAVASENTWEKRVAEIAELLAANLP